MSDYSNELRKVINTGSKKRIAIDLFGKESDARKPRFISTGSTILDYMISNSRNGGIPRGKMVEFSGFNASGKSLLGSTIIASTQRLGGLGILIDNEHAANFGFMETLGVDLEDLVYLETDNVEETFDTIEKIIANVIEKRKAGNDKPVTIVWDSVSVTPSTEEFAGNYERNLHRSMQKAKALELGLKKLILTFGRADITLVFLSHLKQIVPKPMFGDEFYTPGGQSIPYYSSARVRLFQSTRIKPASKDTQLKNNGITCRAECVKTRFGPSLRSCKFPIYFDMGIADEESWYDVLRESKYIKGVTKKYLCNKDVSDAEAKEVGYGFFTKADDKAGWVKLMQENPEARKFAEDKLEEHLVVNYLKKQIHDKDKPNGIEENGESR